MSSGKLGSHISLGSKLRSLVAFVAAAAFFSLAAAAQTAITRGNAGGEPFSLDPHHVRGIGAGFIIGDMLEGLTTENVGGDIVGGAAERWDVSDDGLTWTFHIRKGAVWSDGTPVTADDFVYSWRRLLDPRTAAPQASILYVVKNARTVNGGDMPVDQLGVFARDAHTFIVTLEHPAPYFGEIAAHQAAFPVPRWKIEKFGEKWTKADNYVSNGAFQLLEWRVQEYIRLKKSPTYYDAANVSLDVVTYVPIIDVASALKRYQAGELDMHDNFPNNRFKQLSAELGDQVKRAPYLLVSYMTFNVRRTPFDDVRIRQALSFAYDRQTIADKIYALGEPVACSIVPPQTANYEPGATSPDCLAKTQDERMARAKALLAEAGHGPDNPLTFRFYVSSNDDSRRAAIVAQAMWKKIGVRAELVALDPTTLYTQHLQTGDFDVAMAGAVGDYNDPETFLSLFETGNVGLNFGGWTNPAYDALMQQARREPEAAKRARAMRQAEQILLDDYGVAPTRFRFNLYLVKDYVTGWTGNIRGVNRSRWLGIDAQKKGVAGR
jgi:oligopeptide transport system substrate-binding protein